MGAYSYCKVADCGLGLKPATAFEVMHGSQTCSAGHDNDPNRTLGEVVWELEERVEGLEESLRSLATVVSSLRGNAGLV